MSSFRTHEAYLDQAWRTLKDTILLKDYVFDYDKPHSLGYWQNTEEGREQGPLVNLGANQWKTWAGYKPGEHPLLDDDFPEDVTEEEKATVPHYDSAWGLKGLIRDPKKEAALLRRLADVHTHETIHSQTMPELTSDLLEGMGQQWDKQGLDYEELTRLLEPGQDNYLTDEMTRRLHRANEAAAMSLTRPGGHKEHRAAQEDFRRHGRIKSDDFLPIPALSQEAQEKYDKIHPNWRKETYGPGSRWHEEIFPRLWDEWTRSGDRPEWANKIVDRMNPSIFEDMLESYGQNRKDMNRKLERVRRLKRMAWLPPGHKKFMRWLHDD